MTATTTTPGNRPALVVDGLDVVYRSDSGDLPVLRGVSLVLASGEILGIVGESGCGKSTLGATILGLLPTAGRVTRGRVLVGEEDVTRCSPRRLRRLRGSGVSMIFQDPLTSLNPTFTLWQQFRVAARANGLLPRGGAAELRSRVLASLEEVGIADAEQRLRQYPHELSGGTRQRVMIALTLMLRSRVLVADEPTSALDVILQAQIIALLARLRRDHGTSIVFISHDLGLVSRLCDQVAVMYAGVVVEKGPVAAVLQAPAHPYTRALLASAPSRGHDPERPLATIKGRLPDLSALPVGCTFADRCPMVDAVCRAAPVGRTAVGRSEVRCCAVDASSGHPAAVAARTGRMAP